MKHPGIKFITIFIIIFCAILLIKEGSFETTNFWYIIYGIISFILSIVIIQDSSVIFYILFSPLLIPLVFVYILTELFMFFGVRISFILSILTILFVPIIFLLYYIYKNATMFYCIIGTVAVLTFAFFVLLPYAFSAGEYFIKLAEKAENITPMKGIFSSINNFIKSLASSFDKL